MNWKDKIGEKVIFTGKIKKLDYGSIGILKKVYDNWAVIVYPQNSGYEDNGKGGWKPIKKSPNKVYAHSCKLTEIKLV